MLEKITLNRLKEEQRQLTLKAVKEPEVHRYYNDFQTFMNWKDPPAFEVCPIHTDNFHAETIAPTTSNSPFTIELSPAVSRMQGNSYKAVLYHEFTHIFDDVTIHKEIIDAGLSKPASWYTEAHATEIELMYLCGFENAQSTNRIPFESTIYFSGAEITLAEFGEQKKREFKEHLSVAKQKRSEGQADDARANFAAAIKRVQYYFGFLRFVKFHCDVEIDLIRYLLDDNTFHNDLGLDVLKIRSLICKRNLSHENFQEMNEYSQNLIKFWLTHN